MRGRYRPLRWRGSGFNGAFEQQRLLQCAPALWHEEDKPNTPANISALRIEILGQSLDGSLTLIVTALIDHSTGVTVLGHDALRPGSSRHFINSGVPAGISAYALIYKLPMVSPEWMGPVGWLSRLLLLGAIVLAALSL